MGYIYKYTKRYWPQLKFIKKFNKRIIVHFDESDLLNQIGGKNQLSINKLFGIDNNIFPSRNPDKRYLGWTYNLVTEEITFLLCIEHPSFITDYNYQGLYVKELCKVKAKDYKNISIFFNKDSMSIWVNFHNKRKLIVGGYYPEIYKRVKYIYPRLNIKSTASHSLKYIFEIFSK